MNKVKIAGLHLLLVSYKKNRRTVWLCVLSIYIIYKISYYLGGLFYTMMHS